MEQIAQNTQNICDIDYDIDYIKDVIKWLEVISSIELTVESHDVWFEDAEELAEFEICDYILFEIKQCFETMYINELLRGAIRDDSDSDSDSINELTKQIEELCSSENQIEQRTSAWYKHALSVITASEIGDLFGNQKAARAKLLQTKLLSEPPIRNQSLATISEYMSPFDWGIRFEPVVKQIYEYINKGANIRELGRITSKRYGCCSASPDGILYYPTCKEKHGNLIEIKCPVTRIPNENKIPKDYYHQMQMQMFCTERKKCQFVEAVISSPYKSGYAGERCSPSGLNGTILLINKNGQYQYKYLEINKYYENDLRSCGILQDNEILIEIIPWSLTDWIEQTVEYDENWWIEAKPLIDKFWEDVAAAKQNSVVQEKNLAVLKKKSFEFTLVKMDGQT